MIFARLAKLQAFQDGNKRTALIAANAAFGSFASENFLLVPMRTSKRYIFTGYLMDFYTAESDEAEMMAFNRMMEQVDNQMLTKSIFENIPMNVNGLKTKRVED
jgi:prophage maintenance system killer protein